MRVTTLGLALLLLAACGAATGPAGTPSVSNVNPVTGSRGGSSSGNGSSGAR